MAPHSFLLSSFLKRYISPSWRKYLDVSTFLRSGCDRKRGSEFTLVSTRVNYHPSPRFLNFPLSLYPGREAVLTHFWLSCVLWLLFVAVIRQRDQGNLYKRALNLGLTVSEGCSMTIMAGSMVAGGQAWCRSSS